MELLNFVVKFFFLYILVLTRISGLMIMAPMFGSQNIPNTVKIGISGLIAMAVTPLLVAGGLVFHPPQFLSEFFIVIKI